MKLRKRIGWLLTGLITLFLLGDAFTSLLMPQVLVGDMVATGFTPSALPMIGLAAASGAVLFALPMTGMVGAIVITGFLGGAICTHFRIGEVGSPPQILCLVVGVVTWTALALRDTRVAMLLLRPSTRGDERSRDLISRPVA